MLLLLSGCFGPTHDGFEFVANSGAYTAENPTHDMTLSADTDGMTVAGEWGGVRLRLTAWGVPGAMIAAKEPAWRSDDHTLATDHGGMEEWWRNAEQGPEHGFTVHEAPAGDTIAFDVAVPGAAVEIVENEAVFFLHDSVPIAYRGLHATDAAGRELPVFMARSVDGVRIGVEVTGAAFPVIVDPVVMPYWFVTGSASADYFGSAVAGLGDVNGDGYTDFAVGGYGTGSGGAVSVFFGGGIGPSRSADWSYSGTQANMDLGYRVVNAGDVNGDGVTDLAVSAPRYDNGSSNEGVVYVFHGDGTSFGATPDWSYESDQISGGMGTSLAGAGDVNGDGYDDLLLGAPAFDYGSTDEGKVWLVEGGPSGLGSTATWSAEGNQTLASFGSSLAFAGDVDGDGYDDIVIGASQYDDGETNEGAVFVYHGSDSGPAASPTRTITSNQANASLGAAVAGVADVDMDGYDEIVVTATAYDNGSTDEGMAWLYAGSAWNTQTAPSSEVPPS